MVPVRVIGVAVDGSSRPVVLLAPLDPPAGPRTLVPIWVGSQEAASISVAVNGEDTPRPLSHDLMRSLLTAVGAAVERVDVTRIDAGTFYAELTVSSATGPVVLDCRPSDGIALAVRAGAPMFVAEAVLVEAGVTEADEPADEDDQPLAPEEAERRVAEFRRFLDDVGPEDFEA